MFYFVIEWILVSIAISILSSWLDWIPQYPKRKYTLLQNVLNTGFITIILTVLLVFDIYPSWIIVSGLILLILYLSVQMTNRVAGTKESKKEVNWTESVQTKKPQHIQPANPEEIEDTMDEVLLLPLHPAISYISFDALVPFGLQHSKDLTQILPVRDSTGGSNSAVDLQAPCLLGINQICVNEILFSIELLPEGRVVTQKSLKLISTHLGSSSSQRPSSMNPFHAKRLQFKY